MSLLTLCLYPDRFIPPFGQPRLITKADPMEGEEELIADEEISDRPNKRTLVEYALQSGCTSLKQIMEKTGMSKGGIRMNMERIQKDNLVEIKPKHGNVAAVYKWIGEA